MMRHIMCVAVMLVVLVGVSSAANVKQNTDIANERLLELQSSGTLHKQQVDYKSINEKSLYKHAIVDMNEELDITSNMDSSTIICGKTQNGEIRVKDFGSEHKIRNLKIAYKDVQNLPGASNGYVKITHINDAGVVDAVWVQYISNDKGYVYIDQVPFSEVIIGGYVGIYEKTGVMIYNTSNVFSLGGTFTADDVNYINVSITPQYTESSPYNINTTGLVAWWKFDETNGTAVLDSSPNGNNGTATGVDWVSGKYNNAGRFDGINSDIVTMSSWQNTSNATFVFFVNNTINTTSTTYTPVISTVNYAQNGGFAIVMRGSGQRLSFSTSSTSYDYVNWCFDSNKLTMVTVIYQNNSKLEVYKNLSKLTTSDQKVFIDELKGTPLKIGSYSYNGTIDNVIIYNRTLSYTEIKQIYYDNLEDLQLKTNSNIGYSSPIDVSGSVSVPVDSTDDDVISLMAYVPDTVNISGITVDDYTSTVTPFNMTAEIGYTENTTLVSELLADEYYQIVMRHTPDNNYTDGVISYTSDGNSILNSSYLVYGITSNNPNATLSYDTENRVWSISTGHIIDGNTYNYNIFATVNGTEILNVRGGIGNEIIETYPITANETYVMGSVFVMNSDNGIFGDITELWNTSTGLIAVLVVIVLLVMCVVVIKDTRFNKGAGLK